MATLAAPDAAKRRSTLRTGLLAALLAISMVGAGFAAVPLYRLFCQVTGFGGTVQRADAETAAAIQAVSDRITVRFDANIRGLGWDFGPERVTDTVPIGGRDLAIYIAENRSDEPSMGTATFNVVPLQAGKYFHKIQCFCFTNQELQPGQQMRMPVLYYIDPAILDDPDTRDIEEITLSYTFFPVDPARQDS
jgi:cytochrome c oxidase assembly protein subunit 11